MDLSLLVRGTILGFSIAAPVGPIGVLVIRESMTAGRKAGLLTGLGAATADGFYGLIGGLGLTAVRPEGGSAGIATIVMGWANAPGGGRQWCQSRGALEKRIHDAVGKSQ